VVLEGVDKYNNLFGSVVYPEGDKLLNLGEQIMQVRGQGPSSVSRQQECAQWQQQGMWLWCGCCAHPGSR
jgi:hypothetical protein